jgi:serine/threonine protein kinase
VGQGAFGKVFQVRKKDTGEIFAMKVRAASAMLLCDLEPAGIHQCPCSGSSGSSKVLPDCRAAFISPAALTLRTASSPWHQVQPMVLQVMRKDRILERDHRDYVRAERDVLTAVVHPYIVTLRYSFQVGWASSKIAVQADKCRFSMPLVQQADWSSMQPGSLTSNCGCIPVVSPPPMPAWLHLVLAC